MKKIIVITCFCMRNDSNMLISNQFSAGWSALVGFRECRLRTTSTDQRSDNRDHRDHPTISFF